MRPDRVALYSSSDRIFCDAGIRLHWPFGNLQLQSGWADKGTNRMVGWTTEFVSVLSFSSTDGVYMLHLNRPLPPSGILSRLDLTLSDPRFQCLHSLLQVFDIPTQVMDWRDRNKAKWYPHAPEHRHSPTT